MNILPKKSWHVRNKDNIARVRRDEAQAAEAEREVQRRVERAEQEARTAYLRQKSRAACHAEGLEALEEDQPAAGEKHLNLFPVEEAGEKRGNAEYLKEKKEEKERQERAIGLLVSLGPAPGTEATPWYLKDRGSKEEKKEEQDKVKKEKWRSDEEKEKKDRRLKDSLDPMRDMKKALAMKDKHKTKKNERSDKGEKRSGESRVKNRAFLSKYMKTMVQWKDCVLNDCKEKQRRGRELRPCWNKGAGVEKRKASREKLRRGTDLTTALISQNWLVKDNGETGISMDFEMPGSYFFWTVNI
ncbi:hypothetical protein JZ751_008277 [Albula glossodonta]|uniref:CBF1-interacting co-repressor CIR N-terminal domain-containing protein n=1 Tax=Albula glossodonta TaxID=121402 RepID=A0A8T2N1J4_9TELE|nr:hypothetical protein JZ751_008277 [Albula glossodonta]